MHVKRELKRLVKRRISHLEESKQEKPRAKRPLTRQTVLLAQLRRFPQDLVSLIISYDPYLEGQCVRTFKHGETFKAIASLPDNRIVAASGNYYAEIFSLTGGKKFVVPNHGGKVDSVATFPDGRVVTASSVGIVGVWAPPKPFAGVHTLLQKFETRKMRFEKGIHHVAVSPESDLLVTQSADNSTSVWFEPLFFPSESKVTDELSFQPHGKSCDAISHPKLTLVTCAAFLSNNFVITGSQDTTLKISEFSGNCLITLRGHSKAVTDLAVLSDGRIVSASDDATLKLWTPEGQLIKTLSEHREAVTCVVALKNGRFVSGSKDKTLKIWSSRGSCVATLLGHSAPINCLTVLPNGNLVSTCLKNKIKVWK